MWLVPALRFPEFSGEWDEYAIGEILSIGNGRDYKHLHNGDIPVFGTGGYMTSVDDFLYDGESVFVGRKGTINKPLYYNGKFWTVDTLFYTYNFTDVLPKFVYCLFQTINWLKYNEASGVPSLSKATIEKIKVRIPSMDEQDKLSNLLFLLDKRIEVQNKIIEKLQSLIKGLRVCCMQRVYGNNVYLSEIAQIYQPQTISSTELTEDGFLVYGANGIIGKYKDYNHETEQICITCRGNTCGMVNYTKPMSWITGNAMVINTDKYQDKVCKRYLYHYLSAYNFNSIISGSGQPQIVRTPLEKLKITLPTISEQKQKAIIFDKIQDKIDINHKVLNLYIGQKQYLLRQMFI